MAEPPGVVPQPRGPGRSALPKSRALVIGGGVEGVCSAYYLVRAGWDVTLVEKGDVCAGSSYGNGGLIVPGHAIPMAAPGVWLTGLKWMLDPESPFYIRPRLDPELFAWLWRFRGACNAAHVRRAVPLIRDLSYASLALYRELAAVDGLEFGFRQDGALKVFRTERAYEEAVRDARLLEEAGIAVKILDAAAARQVEPSLVPEVVGAILLPDDAHLIPDAFVKGLASVGQRLGVKVRTWTEVLGFRTAGRRIALVETTRGEFEADEIVLAAGAWSPVLARMLGLTLPLQPGKGYSVTYRRPANGPRMPLLLGEARVGVTPMEGRLRFAGTLELAGLDFSIDRRRVNAIVRAPARYVRGVDDLPVIEIWRGLRPCTPDGLPMIGRSERLDNLILATGHAHIGVSLGPVTGKLVSQLAADEKPLVEVTALKPERFG